jgi:Cdc6-like AAA superfamily ATPase
MDLSRLPTITLLSGPSGSGKTVLANLLFDEVKGLQCESFDYPVRCGVLGAFYEGAPTIDLTNKETLRGVLPGTSTAVSSHLDRYRQFLRATLGSTILSDLLIYRISEDLDYFERIVIDDATLLNLMDVVKVVSAFEEENCLLVHVRKPEDDTAYSLLPTFEVRKIAVINEGTPDALLRSFWKSLEAQS